MGELGARASRTTPAPTMSGAEHAEQRRHEHHADDYRVEQRGQRARTKQAKIRDAQAALDEGAIGRSSVEAEERLLAMGRTAFRRRSVRQRFAASAVSWCTSSP